MFSSWAYKLVLFAAVLLHFCIAYYIDRSNTFAVICSFGLLWILFFMQKVKMQLGARQLIALGMMLRSVYLLSVPELSDDVFRYLWDGLLLNQGISPFEKLPTDLLPILDGASFQELFPLLNSPEYYSIYPPVLQFFFGLSTWLGGGDVFSSIIILRLFGLLAELGTMVLIWKLLKVWKMEEGNLILYALNPLVIAEYAGNLHSEVLMLFFLLLSLWLLNTWVNSNSSKDKFLGSGVLSAIAFGLSVGTKLLPLMLLPFYIKRLGLGRTLVYGSVVVAVLGLMYVPFWSAELIPNVLSSVRLYFVNFEFNASVYYLLRSGGIVLTGYNQIAVVGRLLSIVVLVSILYIAWRDKDDQVSGLPKLMLFAWFIYYALATTVNPWYVTVMAAFLPFTKYRFALVWMVMIPVSYHAFAHADYHEISWVITLEYLPVYLWLLMEIGVFRWFKLKLASDSRVAS